MSDTQLGKLTSAVATLTDTIAAQTHKITDLEKKVDETKEIVEAWAAVKTFGKFIKWIGILVGSLTAIAVGVRLGVTHVFGR